MTDENKHKKKIMGATAVAVLIIAYAVAYCLVVAYIGASIAFAALGLIVSAIIIAVCLYVLHERVAEIKSGEEDDLYKY